MEEDDASDLASEDDGVGCPLPSTPVEQGLLECEVWLQFSNKSLLVLLVVFVLRVSKHLPIFRLLKY